MNTHDDRLISVRELADRSKELLPVPRHYKTVLRYVKEKYTDIFKPITKGHGTGRRHYVSLQNIKEFNRKFWNNEL